MAFTPVDGPSRVLIVGTPRQRPDNFTRTSTYVRRFDYLHACSVLNFATVCVECDSYDYTIVCRLKKPVAVDRNFIWQAISEEQCAFLCTKRRGTLCNIIEVHI